MRKKILKDPLDSFREGSFEADPDYWAEKSAEVFKVGLRNPAIKGELLDLCLYHLYRAEKSRPKTENPKISPEKQNLFDVKGHHLRRAIELFEAMRYFRENPKATRPLRQRLRDMTFDDLRQTLLWHKHQGMNFNNSKSVNELRKILLERARRQFKKLLADDKNNCEPAREVWDLLDDYHRFKLFVRRHILGKPLN